MAPRGSSQRDIEDLKRLPGVHSVSAAVWSYGYPVSYGNSTPSSSRLMGIEANFFDCIHLPMASGRAISEADVGYRKSVWYWVETSSEGYLGKVPTLLDNTC